MPNLENARTFKTDYAGRELVVEIGKYAERRVLGTLRRHRSARIGMYVRNRKRGYGLLPPFRGL